MTPDIVKEIFESYFFLSFGVFSVYSRVCTNRDRGLESPLPPEMLSVSRSRSRYRQRIVWKSFVLVLSDNKVAEQEKPEEKKEKHKRKQMKTMNEQNE